MLYSTVFPTGFCETCGGRGCHINLHRHDVVASSLLSDEFWHYRSVLLYELSHTAIQLNAQ